MTTNPPTPPPAQSSPAQPLAQPPLTLFDASQFEFEAAADMKTPNRPAVRVSVPGGFAAAVPARKFAVNPEAAQARRRRARARLAKRRYLADTDGFERIEQTRRALHLVAD